MRSEKLNLNKDFRRTYGRGQSYVDRSLVTYVLPTRRGTVRYGITTGKKIGCAVMRNRAKRVITAAFREFEGSIIRGADIVFVARTATPYAKSTDVARVVGRHLASAGLLAGEDKI